MYHSAHLLLPLLNGGALIIGTLFISKCMVLTLCPLTSVLRPVPIFIYIITFTGGWGIIELILISKWTVSTLYPLFFLLQSVSIVHILLSQRGQALWGDVFWKMYLLCMRFLQLLKVVELIVGVVGNYCVGCLLEDVWYVLYYALALLTICTQFTPITVTWTMS